MGNFDLLEHAGEEASGEDAVAKVIAAKVAQPSEPMEPKEKKDHHQQQPDGEGDENPGENIARGAGRGNNNGNGGNNQVHNENNGQYQQAYNENNGQYQQDGYTGPYNNNYGQRQGYRRDDGQSRRQNLQYVPKSKPSSEAASDADQKSEGKVEEPAAEAPQKEPIAENVDAAPASESEKAAGDVAKDGPKKPKAPNVKRLTGSQSRKLKKKNPTKEDSNDGDGSKKSTHSEQVVTEEEKQEMTLEEYEKKLGKKSLEPSKHVDRNTHIEQVVIEEEKQEMTLEEYEKKLEKKKGKERIMEMTLEEYEKELEKQKDLEEYEKELEKQKGLERRFTSIEELGIKKFGARMPISLDKIGIVDHRLHLTLRKLGVSLEPVCIHRKRLSIADRTMAKHRVEGKSWQARHGVRFPLAKILTPEEETQMQVRLQACAYDRTGDSFMVECKKIQGREESRITSGWGDFLTRNKLVVQQDVEPEQDELVVLEVWAFRSPALELGVHKQLKDPLGLIFVHYRKGESPHGDSVIAELAAGSRLPDLDEAAAGEIEGVYGLLMLSHFAKSSAMHAGRR